MSLKKIQQIIKDNQVKFVDLRFTDPRGKEQHVTVTTSQVTEQLVTEGKMFDGSSIAGFKSINESDMSLVPDLDTAVLDPFTNEPTLILRCDIHDPTTDQSYDHDPRSVARRAEEYLKSTGIADTANFGPEPEFFILDDVRWKIDMDGASYAINSSEAAWNSYSEIKGGNLGHRPRVKGGYFPVPPVDSSQDLRSAMCLVLEQMGLDVEVHHHEVAASNQNEINTRFKPLLRKADEIQILKYVVHNTAHAYGKTATFMPKPIVGDNGSGMHCHLSLLKDKKNLFSGKQYAGLSDTALHFIGGIIKHAKALNAFTNSTTNSYKRLVPGFEAPVLLAYSAKNRSAAIRIPHADEKSRRIEIRFPDPATNPYLCFSALLMAGIDGITQKLNPGAAIDENLYEYSQKQQLGSVASTLEEAIEALEQDHTFLMAGEVFSQGLIESYCLLKKQEVERLYTTTHPVEFDMYYSL